MVMIDSLESYVLEPVVPPMLPRELWLPKFTAEWMAAQPRFPPRLAREVAEFAWKNLHMLPPMI